MFARGLLSALTARVAIACLYIFYSVSASSSDLPRIPVVDTSARAEITFPKFSLYGVKTLSECAPILAEARFTLAKLNSSYPADWTIDIACTDMEWQRILRMADQHKTNTAFSVLEKKHTIINGAIFRKWRSSYTRTLSHELGHILCNCADEAVAEKLAAKIER
jgi:hypothetical protein